VGSRGRVPSGDQGGNFHPKGRQKLQTYVAYVFGRQCGLI